MSETSYFISDFNVESFSISCTGEMLPHSYHCKNLSQSTGFSIPSLSILPPNLTWKPTQIKLVLGQIVQKNADAVCNKMKTKDIREADKSRKIEEVSVRCWRDRRYWWNMDKREVLELTLVIGLLEYVHKLTPTIFNCILTSHFLNL